MSWLSGQSEEHRLLDIEKRIADLEFKARQQSCQHCFCRPDFSWVNPSIPADLMCCCRCYATTYVERKKEKK